MYSKSGRVVIAFIVIVELCNCNALSSFVPLKRGSPAVNFGARAVAQHSIAEDYAGPPIDESVVSSQNKVGLLSVSQQDNALSYSGVSINQWYAERGDFTYQVFIQYYEHPYCTGALLSDRWVLSSAQCINSTPLESLLIVVGALFPGEGDMYICETKKIHDEFNSATLENDIGLLSTNKPILFHQYVQPIPYYKGPIKACDGEKVVVGYGQNYGGLSPYIMQYLSYLNVSVISKQECQVLLTDISSSERYFTTSICVMPNVVSYESLLCSGLGGEPLVTSARVLFGIKSVQIYCQSNIPTIFTGVSNFAEWIAANTNVIGVDNI